MNYLNSGICPVCSEKLKTNRLACLKCGAEFPVSEPLSPYDYLSDDQREFLDTFLKCKGNIKDTCAILNQSYPTVKKRFDNLLITLGFMEENSNEQILEEQIDMSIYSNIESTVNASDIIKKKLYENNGVITIPQFGGKSCKVIALNDGKSFTSNKLNNCQAKYKYTVFDDIVDLLLSHNGRAKKGVGRNKEDKVGYGKCVPGTVLYEIATKSLKKRHGESTFDPVFIMAAILEWADIARNCRGYIELTASYKLLRAGQGKAET